MTGYLLDMDFVLWHLKDESPQRILLKLLGEGGVPYVSAFSFYEIYAGEACQSEQVEKVKEFLSCLKIYTVDADIAYLAGKIFRENKLPLGAAFMAATCLHHDCVLVTRCPEIYPVQGLKCFVPEDEELSHAERITVL